MDSIFKFEKKGKGRLTKYIIFSMFFLLSFSLLLIFNNNIASAAPQVDSVFESNYNGNTTSENANEAIKHSDGIRYFIQGTGIEKEDVITFSISGLIGTKFDRIAISEPNYTMASSSRYDYDTYAIVGDNWTNDSTTNLANSNETGLVGSADQCASFSTDASTSTLLKANNSASNYTSLFCLTSDGSSLNYAYTIRNEGYGLKTINIFLYETVSGEASETAHLVINVIVSKPISSFNTTGFTWLDAANETCPATNVNPVGAPATNNICVSYVNGGYTTSNTEVVVTIPMEVAYNHNVTNRTAATIPSNSIYAINTFKNEGSGKDVKYYYYDFNWKPYTYPTSDTTTATIENNTDMLHTSYYNLNLYIDASGKYSFYIKDYFGNTFESTTNAQGTVDVTDVSKRNILIDYVNADQLTILSASVSLSESGTSIFGGGVVQITYDETAKVLYVNLQKDSATIVLEVFSKTLITLGEYYCPTGSTAAECAATNGTVEDIRKEALTNSSIATTQYWKVASIAGDTTPATVPGTATSVLSGSYIQGKSSINSGFNVNGISNRLEISVTANGRYRFYIQDRYGNNTAAITGDTANAFINPYVEVTVIDSTTPTLSTGLTDANTNTINSYNYVKGGGQNQKTVDLNADKENTTIYYNINGSKLFNYEDAITIAQITANDATSFNDYLINYVYTSGAYTDPSESLYSDRNTAQTTTTISGANLHNYILTNDISSFTGGLVVPTNTVDITSSTFTLGSTTYTINYEGSTDKPVSLSGGGTTVTVTNGREFTISGNQYIISGNRVVSYNTNSTKVPVIGTTYTVTDSDIDKYLYIDETGSVVTNTTSVSFVSSLDNPSYANTYIGFLTIEFIDLTTSATICTIGEDTTVNSNCFKEINKRIDTVRDFKMKFVAHDYVGHVSDPLEITVHIDDDTAPGFTSEFKPQGDELTWTNKFSSSTCMLEIGNVLQSKTVLINCYLLASGSTYHYIDNDTTYPTDNGGQGQWYVESGYTNYFNSIKLEIEGDDGNLIEVTDSETIIINKARDHDFVVTIYDNWSSDKNSLKIEMNYYINPRILLIEPKANEKVYGDADPTFDYCVYINKDNTTFNQIDKFFNISFVNEYFKLAYCTSSTYFPSDTSNVLDGVTSSTIVNDQNVLLNGNKFTGALSRVQSEWYNREIRSINNVQNNYVGYYNIVLGSLAVDASTVTAGSGYSNNYDYSRDYVVKINPNYLIGSASSDTANIEGTNQLGESQIQDKQIEVNDVPKTESKVLFTIKQAVLTVAANGGSKVFGEQDSNSNNWNAQGTVINSSSATGYLNGYTVSGLKVTTTEGTVHYNDSIALDNLIAGVLRREIGEVVGRYMICNILATSPSVTSSDCNLTYNAAAPTAYSVTAEETYMYAAYDRYGVGGVSSVAALTININSTVYGENIAGKTLNQENRNYVISFEEAEYIINANEMIIQPGVNQGKEFSASSYNDPIWQLVVYGETVVCSSVNSCTSNIVKVATNEATNFNGYTDTIATASYTTPTIATYQEANDKQKDTDIYYSKRKTSPDTSYIYQTGITLTRDGDNYTNVYTLAGSYYYLNKTLTSAVGGYVYAYGTYHQITDANLNTTTNVVTISIVGHLVNQTYTLFKAAGGNLGTAKLTRTAGEDVGWYTFNSINNNTSTFAVAENTNKEHCTIADSLISVGISTSENNDYKSPCKNYNLSFEESAPDAYTFTTEGGITSIASITTTRGTTNVYKPNGVNECTDVSNSGYTQACSANTDQVLFEIFKREIVISFDVNNYIFNYGQRYDYYDGGTVTINGSGYNEKNGVFKIKDDTSEGDIFVCYNEYHVAVRCTNNASSPITYDYGITSGDTWTSIGLEFYMHSTISKTDSAYYDTGSDDIAIPAGTYYVYANISEAAKANYKFTYLGGTLTISPLVTSVQLTSYTKEYKDAMYYSYGLGTNYSEYTTYTTQCMLDTDYTTSSENLITTANCLNTNNQVGNSYGFTIEGLDSNDTIADNFSGRPLRETGENVGYYKIGVNTISSKQHFTLSNTGTTACTSYDPNNTSFTTDCIFVTGTQNVNYDISYSKTNNEGGYLFITPAIIEIDVATSQTKMYGCAYSSYNVNSNYPYTIAGGYTNCDETSNTPTADISYRYTVKGDKDYNRGSTYEVTGDLVSGNTTSSLEGSLYRVTHTTDPISYSSVFDKSSTNIFQGQSVGSYIITLGDLNAKTNGKTMCDAFNNPAVNGTVECRNYNLDYYGNSASKDSENGAHKYNEASAVNIVDLQTYDLNYVVDTSGTYVLMNGKYVSTSEISSLTNYYVSLASLTKYAIKNDYEVDASGDYVYINGGTVVLSNGNNGTVTGYTLISSLQRYNSDGTVNQTSGTYLRIENRLISLSIINRYSLTAAANKYEENASGNYVQINGEYVAISSLKKYALTNGVYVENTEGTHVLIYLATSNNGLTRYKLDPTDMYKKATDNNGAYVFINGSYVLKSSILNYYAIENNTTQINISSGVRADTDNTKFYGNAAVASNTIFTITRRDVHVHTEYNVKYTGNVDEPETITCAQILSAYGLTDFTGRSYCTDGTTEVTLGTARYYAVDNSLAKYPWTSWVDKTAGISGVAEGRSANDYNDTQFDVLEGALSRAGAATEHDVGKYTYDYANIKVTDEALSGVNYKIQIATTLDWENTYVVVDSTTRTKLSEFTRYADTSGTVDNINGYYIHVNGNYVSISLVDKVRSDNTAINYWYLGFYALDDAEGRANELKKWWTDRSIFANGYTHLINGQDNNGNNLSTEYYIGIYDPDLSEAREVYFEIVRRTIYLYAIDNSKIYGEADLYDNYSVAICATANGYTIDAQGIKCRDGDSYNDEIYGLSTSHKNYFYDTNGAMRQTTIKGGSGYIFVGTDSSSFEIYFKRTAGENVGVYSVTACATQSGITDCTDPSQEESTTTTTAHIGDNYKIIEMAGTLTINTRTITIVPDSDQSFMYGNYTNNGAIPAITYEEYFNYNNASQQQGAVNSGGSSIASSIATCLFNISGESIVCINDNQNDEIRITDRVYIYQDEYGSAGSSAIANATEITYVNSIYKDSYSDPDNLWSKSESDTRHALNRVCGTTEDLRYSRDVCNYVIVDGELEEGSTWVENTIDAQVRIIPSNRYNLTRVDADGYSLYDQNDEGAYLKVGTRYYQISASNRYTYSYVQADEGAYILIGGVYYKIKGASRYSDSSCSTRLNEGNYFKEGNSACTQIQASNRYNLSKTLTQNNEGEFLKIGGGTTDKVYNYTIEEFVENVGYVVSAATLEVNPIENQYKIYGEADPEIRFTVSTTYTVKSDHLVPHSNISSITNSGADVTIPTTRYDANHTVNTSGLYVMVESGWVVTINGYAYQENDDNSALNYGVNYEANKHARVRKSLSQSTSGATHFDKYTTYNATITVSETLAFYRILIGNLFVTGHNQNVGVRGIENGFIVANNVHGDKNYLLPDGNVNSENVEFTIIPRPIYLGIDNISKTYGQATDILSCDNADSDITTEDCLLESGILLNGETLMMNNYHIVSENITLPTSSGISGVYSSAAINLTQVASSTRDGYANITTFTASKYYTADEEIETKNEDLDVKVERGNYNITRETSVCFVNGEVTVSGTGKGCEDVGQYYLRFAGKNSATLGADPTEVAAYYYNDYWGYNTNYYVIITNTTDTTDDTSLNSTNIKTTQVMGATLTINKKAINITVQTFNPAGGNALGEEYEIEENMDVPSLPTVSNSATHTTYRNITWAVHPNQVRTGDELFGYAAYCQTKVIEENASDLDTVREYADCLANALIYHGNGTNNANTGPNVFNTSEAGYYAITRDKDVLYIRYGDGTNMTYSGATMGAYEANNYTTTFVNGLLHISSDNTAPVIFVGTEYHAIEANNGELTDIQDIVSESATYSFLNSLRTNHCSTVTGIAVGGTINYGTDCALNRFTMAIPITNNSFKLNNNDYTIDGSNINLSINSTLVTTISESNTFVIGGTTYTVMMDGVTPIFIALQSTNSISNANMVTLMNWFNIKSHDPSVIRGGENIGKRYDARYYIAIEQSFNQRIVGDYTVFIYALDNAGNISRATTTILRVQDSTKPEVGTLTLYEGTIGCTYSSANCTIAGWTGTVHDKWSNNNDGIWLSITGGRDNAANYLNINAYTKYTHNGTSFTEVSSGGTHILKGSVVLLDNLTQYYMQDGYYIVKDPNLTYAANTVFYVRYNGAYRNITSLTRYNLDSTTNTYTVSSTGAYIVDGDWIQIPTQRYNSSLQFDAAGTYIKLDQWDHYFSRDNGATWIKYDRETQVGYLALGADGQRLIMIKAVDQGALYSLAPSTNNVNGTGNNYFENTYLNKETNVWSVDVNNSETFEQYTGGGARNNISDWAAISGANTYYRDRKYAYLDTQTPRLTLDSNSYWVYEYGCTNCTSGYSEEYGKTIDTYLLDLSLFKRYETDALTTESVTGMYIKLTKKDGNQNVEQAFNISGVIYKVVDGVTTQSACNYKWINDTCYQADNTGDKIYIGISKEANYTKDTSISDQIVGVMGTSLSVYVNDGDSTTSETTVSLNASAGTEQIETSTIYNVSGVSGSNLMSGTQNTSVELETLDHAHKQVVIYLAVASPNGTSGNLTGSIFGSLDNSVTTYYRYEINYTGTVVDGVEGSGVWVISGTYSTSDRNATGTNLVLDLGTSTTLSEAIYKIVTNNLTNVTYNGKDLTYSINYTSTDMANNTSQVHVRGITISNFLEIVTATVNTGVTTTSLYNSYEVDVTQNTSVLSVLANFSVTTSKSEVNPLYDTYLVQTIYYNNNVIAMNQKYDANTLSTLDTTIPGVYKVVYTTRRIDGGNLVTGTPFELVINVKPNVASVNSNRVDYKQIIIIAFALASIIAICGYALVSLKKKKFN